MSDKTRANKLTRREFLRRAAVVAGGAAVATGCVAPAAPTAEVVEKVVEVEKVVTATPLARKKVVVQLPPWFAAKLPSLHKWKAEYEAEFPDREVEYLRESFDLTKAALEAQQGESHADMGVTTAVLFLASMVEGDVAAPLTDLVPDDWRDIVPAPFVEENTYNGNLYAWPYGQVGSLLNYRKSMLTIAGHEGNPGETFEEYTTVCEDVQSKVTAPDGSQVFGNAFDISWWWRAPSTIGVNMMGADFFGDDGYMAWDDPRTPEVFRVLKTLSEYAPPEVYEPGYAGVEVFGAGKAAIFFGQSEQVLYLADATFGSGDLALAFPPVFPGGEANPRTVNLSDAIFLFKHGHLEEAWHFLNWLWPREDFHMALANEAKWIPVNLSFAEAEWMPSSVTEVIGMIKTGVAIPTTIHYWEFATHARAALTDYLLGQIETPEEAVAKAKKDFEVALATG